MHLCSSELWNFCSRPRYLCVMQHKGIEYTLVPGHGPHRWAWVTHTSPPKSGTARSQIAAMLTARRAIDRWCRENSALCAPRVDDPIVVGLADDTTGKPNKARSLS